eukprot:SAG11_NODE_341_length_10462_cov_49.272990_8_plen_94_part_00
MAYIVGEKDLAKDGSKSSLWMAPTSGEGDSLRMSAPGSSVSSPRWSPDGALLSFISSRPIEMPVKGNKKPKVLKSAQVCAHIIESLKWAHIER